MRKFLFFACVLSLLLSLPVTALAQASISAGPDSSAVEYKVELTWFLKLLAKMVEGHWLKIKMTNSFSADDHAITLTNGKDEEFFYLDRSNPEKWKLESPLSKKRPQIPKEVFVKMYALFVFIEDKNLQPGQEIFVSYYYPPDKKESYRGILVVAGDLVEEPFPDKKDRTYRGREFKGFYYESKEPLTRNALPAQADEIFEGVYMLDAPYHGALKLKISVEISNHYFEVKLTPKPEKKK